MQREAVLPRQCYPIDSIGEKYLVVKILLNRKPLRLLEIHFRPLYSNVGNLPSRIRISRAVSGGRIFFLTLA